MLPPFTRVASTAVCVLPRVTVTALAEPMPADSGWLLKNSVCVSAMPLSRANVTR